MTDTLAGLGRSRPEWRAAEIASGGTYTSPAICAVPGCGQPRDAMIHAPEG